MLPLGAPRCLAASRRSQTFSAFYATIRGLRHTATPEMDEPEPADNDFILSILKAGPSLRDSRSYLEFFGPRARKGPILVPDPVKDAQVRTSIPQQQQTGQTKDTPAIEATMRHAQPTALAASILNPVYRRTALVKVQGPFNDTQLDSIARGIVYLEKLGLTSVIVVDNDQLARGVEGERPALIEDAMRLVKKLEGQGVRARPVLDAVVRLGPKPGEEEHAENNLVPTEAHTFPADLITIRSALRAGEIPVLPPLALDSFCRSTPVDANDVIAALARGMVEAAALEDAEEKEAPQDDLEITRDVDLTPLRLMIINREGGVPSYARNGKPHLLINLSSEYDHIHDTFHEPWKQSNPSALSNLSLARKCLTYMPPTSSAIMVSHRSPSSLIANLITNKPAMSSSLPHALLQGKSELAPHTPTLLRRGVPVRVLRTLDEIDRPKMNNLLEQSFGRKLDEESFYQRLERSLDFVIVAGDYAGAAIVTNEACPNSSSLSYLDKFAVLPSHQGDGTVDFLWVALHDESYGLGLSYSVNPNGGKEGRGEGRDLVWRSRSNNPINKWYFERSTGHVRLGSWVLFWCDAEKRLKTEESRRPGTGLSYVEDWEAGRLASWADTALKVPSSWK